MKKEIQSRINLFLIEAALLLLVFSITSSIILSVFIKANDMRIKAQQLNEAVIYAQNIVEGLQMDVDLNCFSSDALYAEVDGSLKTFERGTMHYYTIRILDRHTEEVIYEIETGIYSDQENK